MAEITDRDRELAWGCVQCPLCKRARERQRGIAYWFVKHLENDYCPNCKAYERVYGRKAHEPEPPEVAEERKRRGG
jgi:transposase-like protein